MMQFINLLQKAHSFFSGLGSLTRHIHHEVIDAERVGCCSKGRCLPDVLCIQVLSERRKRLGGKAVRRKGEAFTARLDEKSSVARIEMVFTHKAVPSDAQSPADDFMADIF